MKRSGNDQKSYCNIPEGIAYCALRYLGTRLMGIQFSHRGKEWRADTVEEALELRAKLEAQDQADFDSGAWFGEEDSHPEAAKVWTPDAVTDLLNNSGDLQRRFIRLISENTELTSEEIVKKLRLDSEVAFAGVLSGLSKQMKRLGISPDHLYTVTVTWSGKIKTRTFKIIRQFKWAAGELGWPDEWPDKERKADAASTK